MADTAKSQILRGAVDAAVPAPLSARDFNLLRWI
jgi:hypothetical protein